MQKLLGIDVINRLSDDLDIYIKQISQKSADTKTTKLIEQLEHEKNECLLLANQERESEDKLKRQLSELEIQVREAEQKIQDRGGAWAKTKNAEKDQADELIKQKAILESKLLNELDGAFPLSLAPNAMASLIKSLSKEQEVKVSQAFSHKLNENLLGLEQVITSQFKDSADDLMATINQYFQSVSEPTTQEIKLDILNNINANTIFWQ